MIPLCKKLKVLRWRKKIFFFFFFALFSVLDENLHYKVYVLRQFGDARLFRGFVDEVGCFEGKSAGKDRNW